MSQFYLIYHNFSCFTVFYRTTFFLHFNFDLFTLNLGVINSSSLWCTVAVRQFEGLLSMPSSSRPSSVKVRTSLNGRHLEVCQKHPPSSGIQRPQMPSLSPHHRYLIFAQPVQTRWETKSPVSGLLDVLLHEGLYP